MLTWKSWPTDSESESSTKMRYFLVTLSLVQPGAATKEIVTSLEVNFSRRFVCESVLPHLSVRECDGVVFRSAEIELAGQIRPNAELYSSHKRLCFVRLQGYGCKHRPAVRQYGVCQAPKKKEQKTQKNGWGHGPDAALQRGKGKRLR